MSPEINIRQVACDSFAVVHAGTGASLRDILYSEKDDHKGTFQSRQLILFPYKVSKKTQAGVPVQSLTCYKVDHENRTKQNTTVLLDNASASNISRQDFHQLMALFGK